MQTDPQFEAILIALKSAGLPFAVAALCTILPTMRSRNTGGAPRHEAALSAAFAALAVLAGMISGFFAINHEQWQFPPAQALHWMPILAVAPVAVSQAIQWCNAGRRAWLAAQVLMAAFAAWVVLPPAVHESGTLHALAWLLPTTVAWVAVWRYLEAMSSTVRCGVALTLSSGVLGFVVSLGGSIVIGGIGSSIAGALAGWLAVGLATGRAPLSRAMLGSVTLLFGSTLVAAFFYAEISAPLLAAVLLGLFFVRLADLLPKAEEDGHLRKVVLSGVAAAPPLLAAAGFAMWSYFNQANAY